MSGWLAFRSRRDASRFCALRVVRCLISGSGGASATMGIGVGGSVYWLQRPASVESPLVGVLFMETRDDDQVIIDRHGAQDHHPEDVTWLLAQAEQPEH